HAEEVPHAAGALEALLDARVADRRALHLAQDPDRRPLGLRRHDPAAGGPDRGRPGDALPPDRRPRGLAAPLPDRHLRDGHDLRPLLRDAPEQVGRPLGVRDPVRLLLPLLPGLADLLRDPHLESHELGDASVEAHPGGGGTGMRKLLRRLREQSGVIKVSALLIPLSIAPVAAVTPVVKDEYGAFMQRFEPRAPKA